MPKVIELMHSNVTTIKGETMLPIAIDLMVTNNIGSIIVIDDNDQPIGIVTEKDLIRKVLAERRDPSKTRVSQVMSKPLITATEKTTVDEAARIMLDKKITHLIITAEDGKRMLGMLSAGDIMKELTFLKWLSETPSP